MLQTRALHLVFHRKVSPILLIALTPSLWISIFPFSPCIPVCPLLFWGFPASRASSFFSNLFSPLIPSFLSHKCGNVVKSVRLSQFCVRTHSLSHLLFWNDVGVWCAVERVSLPVCEWGSCTIVFQFLLVLIVWTCGISFSWCFPSSNLPLSGLGLGFQCRFQFVYVNGGVSLYLFFGCTFCFLICLVIAVYIHVSWHPFDVV